MEYYLATKKKILPFATVWMDLENIMLSEINPAIERQIPYDFTHMWNLMNKPNKQNGDRLIDREQDDSYWWVREWKGQATKKDS